MPRTQLYFYQESPDEIPVRDWLREVAKKNRKAAVACLIRINALRLLGYELRRPAADYLRDGIYELRVKVGRVNYRVLYFFHGQKVALLAHGLTKEQEIRPIEIERALNRKRRYEKNPTKHHATLAVPEDAHDV